MFSVTRRYSSALFIAISVLSLCAPVFADGASSSPVAEQDRQTFKALLDKIDNSIDTLQLDNGMRVICIPQTYTNSVTVAMAYNVGSKHEEPTEFGMAHIVEHMIFKGTKKRSEDDLRKLVRHLGGNKAAYNAYTSMDQTYYYFNTDAGNWPSFVDAIAESAKDMDWSSDALDSEIQAIFQEIKLRELDQIGTWLGTLHSFLPANHPYSHEIIGYKDQIFNFTREDVLAFYKKYYTPDNAVLLVIGDVNPAEVFERAAHAFKDFQGERAAKAEQPRPFYTNFGQTTQKVFHTQPYHMRCFFWEAPGDSDGERAALEHIVFALRKRLKQKWVDTEGWCLQAGLQTIGFKESGLLLAMVIPKDEHLDKDYKALLAAEIEGIMANGITDEEFRQAHKGFMRQLIALAESVNGLGVGIAQSLFPQTSAQGWYDGLEALNEVTPELIKQTAHQYLRPFRMHELHKAPLPSEELIGWQALQQESDAYEHALLSSRRRTNTGKKDGFEFVLPARGELAWPDAVAPDRSEILSNGMTLHYAHNDVSPTVSCNVVLKDAEGTGLAWAMLQKQHAGQFWSGLIAHGTKSMSKTDFDNAFDSMGASAVATPGSLSVSSMKGDIDKALELAVTALKEPFFEKETPAELVEGEQYPSDILQRKKLEFVQMVQMNQNNPSYKFGRFMGEKVMGAYPWSCSEQDDLNHALAVSFEDVRAYHQLMTDPARTVCVVSGDISFDDAKALAEKHLVPALNGTAPAYAEPIVPELTPITGLEHIEMPLSEVMVRGICPTVLRNHPDYAVLVLLDTYFHDLVFDIREETGLFYMGWSSLFPATNRIPAFLGFGAQTGLGRVDETVTRLKDVLAKEAKNGLTQETLDKLRQQWLLSNSKYTNTATTVAMHLGACVSTGRAWDDKAQLRDRIQALTLEQVNDAVRRHCNPEKWVFVTLGRSAE